MSLTARVQPAFIAQQAAQCRPRVETGPKIARALGNDEEIPISPSVGPTDLHMPTAIVDGRHVAVRYQDLDSVGDVHSGARVHARDSHRNRLDLLDESLGAGDAEASNVRAHLRGARRAGGMTERPMDELGIDLDLSRRHRRRRIGKVQGAKHELCAELGTFARGLAVEFSLQHDVGDQPRHGEPLF